jgi:transcriptional regulator with XRE-family HTH domain
MNTLKKALLERGLSQSKASRLADIPQSNFNQICNGKQQPCPAWRCRLSKILEIPEDELFPEYTKKEVE